MTLPTEMTYVDLPKPGPAENMVFAKGPLPVVNPGDILIRVEAAGVNRPDVLQRLGNYPPPPGASPVLGLELAGEVVALGEGTEGFIVGDKVWRACQWRRLCRILQRAGDAGHALAEGL